MCLQTAINNTEANDVADRCKPEKRTLEQKHLMHTMCNLDPGAQMQLKSAIASLTMPGCCHCTLPAQSPHSLQSAGRELEQSRKPGRIWETKLKRSYRSSQTLSSLKNLSLCGILTKHLIKVRLEHGIVFACPYSLILNIIPSRKCGVSQFPPQLL